MTPKLLLLVVGVVTLCACSLAPILVHAQSTSHFLNATLLAANSTSGDKFGFTMATSGSLLVVGAYGYKSSHGAVYMYTCDTTTMTCTQGQQLTTTGTAGMYFGYAVAMSGSLVVVGATLVNAGQGAAYVFSCTSATSCTQGQELQELVASDTFGFGSAVAISGTLVAVGSYDDTVGNNFSQGRVYMFSCSSDGSSCSAGQNLTASDGATNDYFGYSVAMSGTTLAVGAYGSSTSRGAVYMFSCPTATSCTQGLKLTSGGVGMFGYAVAMSGSQMLVGAPAESVGSINSQGAVYVFVCSNSSSCTPGMQVTASDGAANDQFGMSVAIFNNLLMVTAPSAAGPNAKGVVYLFSCTTNGPSCTQGSKLSATDKASGGSFGNAVAIFGSNPAMAVVGVPADSAYNGQGEAFMFATDTNGACECSAGWTGLGCDTCVSGTDCPTAAPTTPTTSSPPIPSASATAPPATSTPTHNAAGSVATSIFAIVASALAAAVVVVASVM